MNFIKTTNNTYIRRNYSIDFRSNVLAGLVFFYGILSDPFIFLSYMPLPLRAFVLIIPIIFILNVLRLNAPFKPQLYFIIWFLFNITYALKNLDFPLSLVKTSMSMFFLISLVSLNEKDRLIDGLVLWWFWLWMYISISVMLIFIGYETNLLKFTLVDFSKISQNANYFFYNNPFLGNYFKYSIFGFDVPKISWFSFEPGLLSYFFGFNVIISSLFKWSNFNRRSIFYFKMINLIAGVLTFSSAYILFLIYYSFFSLFKKNKVSCFILIFIFMIFVISFYDSNYLNSTSAGERFIRLGYAKILIERSDFFDFIFGSGLGISGLVFNAGLSSGILNILIERGFLVFVFILFLLNKLTYNKEIFYFILFYLLAFEHLWYPMFAIGLVISYKLHMRSLLITPSTQKEL